MSDVFLSYASIDRPRIEPLAHALEKEGLQVFWDRDQIEITRGATRQIDDEIRQARVVLLLITRAALASKLLAEEADLALSLGTLMPVRLDHGDESRYLFRMGSIQNLDLVSWSGDSSDKRFRFLVDEIRRRVSDRLSSWDSAPSFPSVPPFVSQPSAAPAPTPPSAVSVTPIPLPPAPVIFPAQPAPPSPAASVPAGMQAPAPVPQAPPPAELVPPPVVGPAAAPVSKSLTAGTTPAGTPAPDVFVAYSRKDSETCRKIVSELRSQGLNVFYDQYIQGGEEWRDMLAWNIKNCSVLMVLFTENSKNSPQVRKEVNLATSHSKSIIPVMIENVALEGGLELELNGINFIPYFDDPSRRLTEAVEKAKTLAAISVFERRRQGLPEMALPALAMPFGPALVSERTSPQKANWLHGTFALLGAMFFAGASAALVVAYSGRTSSELFAALTVAIFFVAFPYMISVMLLFRRLLRSS